MLFHSAKNPVEMKIIHLNKVKNQHKHLFMLELGDKKAVKAFVKKTLKETTKLTKGKQRQKHCFVLDFHGDMKATAVQHLREEISAILTIAEKGDEVILRLESAGGLVHSYGLASSQLVRIKEAGLTLTVCVDKISASGGYMMACVADKILSAPFAVVGSIGVVAQVPNFHDLLEKHDIDVNIFTAGKYKRTVTIFGKNDDEDKAKFQEELEQTHQLFQNFVNQYRPQVDLNKVATGEHWYGTDAKALNLVDDIKTSDSYILECMENQQVYAIQSRQKPTLAEKLGLAQTAKAMMTTAIEKLPDVLTTLENSKLPMFKK